MNKDQVDGKWEQVKGSAKLMWGKLTDDDFKKAEGSVDKLYGVIHERFGDSKEAIKTKFDDAAKAANKDIKSQSIKS